MNQIKGVLLKIWQYFHAHRWVPDETKGAYAPVLEGDKIVTYKFDCVYTCGCGARHVVKDRNVGLI